MGRDRSQQTTPDLFSAAASLGAKSPPAMKPVASAAPERQHILPKNLPNAIKHLSDQELDSLISASLEEAKRRGRLPPNVQSDGSAPKRSSRTTDRRQGDAATVSLTLGKINAVRAAAKAGIKLSVIARQFGLSQSDVRKVLTSVTATRKGT
jgi:hypothetical protein